MNDDNWTQLKENVQKKFKVLDQGIEDLLMDTQDGEVKQGEVEFLVVQTPLGRIKLARESRPKVLEKTFHYSHRAGDTAQTEYKFSDTEKTHKLKLYKWDEPEEEWTELTPESLGGLV